MAKALVRRVRIERRKPAPVPAAEAGGYEPKSAGGVVVDGAAYPCEGEPPIATSKGWGDLGFLYRNRL